MSGYYVPNIIPEEDRKMLEKYHGGQIHRVGFGKRIAVIVVDMTNAFVKDEYPTGFSKTGAPCVKAIKRLLDMAREVGLPIVYTKGDLIKRSEKLPVSGRWADKTSALPKKLLQEADRIVAEISPRKEDIVIAKAKPSAFFGTQLVSILNFLGVDTLIVTGMVTAGCIRATVIDAFSYNYRVIIPEECVADRSQISHEVNLFDMDMKYADVMKLEEILRHLEKIKLEVKERP
jgi:nicotinamidase-related amidase